MRRLAGFAVVMLCAAAAMAQTKGMQPVVAPDGTVLVTAMSISADYRMTAELVAISPAGTRLWSWEGGAMMHSIAVGGTRVIVARNGGGIAMPMFGDSPGPQEIVALSLATGTVQWRRELSGFASGIEVSGNRVYVVTGAVAAMMPGRGGASLVALDANTGAVLWTTALRP